MAIYRGTESTSTASEVFNIDGDKGEITVSNGGDTWTINDNVVQRYDANLKQFVDGFTLPTTDGTSGQVLATNGSGSLSFIPTVGAGTVTNVSVTSANGFAGTVSDPTGNPSITLSTTLTGILKGNSVSMSSAIAGTDYLEPSAIGTTVQAYNANLTTYAATTPTATGLALLDDNTVADQRTTLGLGAIATQNANSVAITGGSITGTSIGASSPSTGSFTSISDSGNLSFTGTGNRITGDFSNATVANRAMFQTSTPASATRVGIIPSQIGQNTQLAFYTDPAITNASVGIIQLTSSEFQISSTNAGGTGATNPMTFYTGGSERMRVDASGNVGIGGAMGGILGSGLAVYRAGINSEVIASKTDATTAGAISMFSANLSNGIYSVGAKPLDFYSNSTLTARLLSDGSFNLVTPAGLGYGTGAGGTVTQATSKSTTVAINKPTGQITMNAASLAANTTVQFNVNNTVVSSTDTVVLSLASGAASYAAYQIWAQIGASNFNVFVRNITAGALAEPLGFNFTVIKGVYA